MTVICAAVDAHECRVHFAADSIATRPSDLTIPKAKLATLPTASSAGGSVVIGVAGDAACLGLITRHLHLDATPDPDDGDDINAWATATATAITKILLDHGRHDQDTPTEPEMVGLLAWRDRLWFIGGHLAIPVTRFCAIGSGEGVATGAMWAASRLGINVDSEIVDIGVDAAIACLAGIAGPIQRLST